MPDSIKKRYDALVKQSADLYSKRDKEETIEIRIGSATCEHAAGALEVEDEFRKHIAASGRTDVVLRRTGCTGRCSREPIVGIYSHEQMPIKYEQVDRQAVHNIFTQHIVGGKPCADHILDAEPGAPMADYELLFCSGTRCGRHMPFDVRGEFERQLAAAGITANSIRFVETNCFGLCLSEKHGDVAHVLIRPSKTIYQIRTAEDVAEIVSIHLAKDERVKRLQVESAPMAQRFFDRYGDVAFFNRQSRIALRNAGVVNPEDIFEHIHFRGFQALTTILSKGDPQWVINELTIAKLRGRGGGGFPTGKKWAMTRAAKGSPKYVICNADEGDPGAFMDRSMLESDPFSVLEGMLICGYTVGANQGFIYVRAEYPLAIERIQHAIAECHKHGLLGRNILGSGFDFDLEVRLGAGAFVCGEETALIKSIEGERGQPRIRPPYPSEAGLWGKPTVINNVETFANLAAIIVYGGKWFSGVGTENSGGTKVFALAGKVNHTGLVEVPMGTTLREVVNEIGGGVAGGKALKAVQTGGPAGGCIPAEYLDTPVDFDTLGKLGSIMGSGGMIVLDEDDCMVDVAKFFLAFSQDESCGKCTPCREGTKRMLEILEKITCGKGTRDDLKKLERLADLVRKSSLCGLGRACPNPVLSTLKYFREEYEAHVVEKRCPAKRCTALIRYEIDPEKCVGCTLCAKNCPVQCISGERRSPHTIDQDRCIKCGRCFEVCRFEAVKRV